MKASFDGAEREFHIARKNISYLESSLGRGLYDVLKDFTDGKWTFRDVAMVISFALHGPNKADKLVIDNALQAIRLGLGTAAVGTTLAHFARSYSPHPRVIEVLEREGHGNYAGLAADILTYTIFGETAEAADDAA